MSYVYDGTNQFPTAITLPDDGDAPGETNFAPGWEGNRDAAVYLLKRVGATALYNFHAPVVATGSYAWTAFVWDGQVAGSGPTIVLNGRWVATQNEGGGAGCRFQTSFEGRVWLQCGSTSSTGAVCLANSLTISGQIAANFCANSRVVWQNIASGGSSTVSPSSGWDASQGVGWNNRTTAKAYFIGATQSGGTFTGAAASFVVSGPTIVNLSANLPVNWVSGTNHVGNYRYATNGTTYVVLMCGVTPVTDTARMLNAGVITAPTDITPSVLASKIGIGIAYDTLTRLWVLCARDASNSYFYTSPDLIAWTLKSTLAGVTAVKEFAVINGAWVFAYSSYDALPSSTIIYVSSSDGAQWNRSQVLVNDTIPIFVPGECSMLFGDAITYGVGISYTMSMA